MTWRSVLVDPIDREPTDDELNEIAEDFAPMDWLETLEPDDAWFDS